MRKATKIIPSMFIIALLFMGNTFSQVTISSDNGSSYGGTWGNGNNNGTGFMAWSNTYGSDTGTFIGSPANNGMGTTGIGTTAFGMYATGTAYVNAGRTFNQGLQVGDTLTFYWAINWDASSGNKGFDLKSGSTTIINVNNTGSATITITDGTVSTDYGTNPMLVTVTRTSSSNYDVSITERDGSGTYTGSFSNSSSIDNINFYVGAQGDGEGNRNMYFNELKINRNADLSITGSAGYRLLSSPVTTPYSTVLEPIWTQGASTTSDTDQGDPNVFTWDRTTDAWEGATNLDANIVAGTGFLVYVYADDDFDDSDDAFPKTLSVSGTENAVDTAPTLNSANDGYTLVGNPFATTIDFDEATKVDLTNVAYVWDPNSGSGNGGTDANGGSGSWKTWTGSAGDLTDGLITPFQGFFVQNSSSASSPSITFSSASKSSGGTFLGKSANSISYLRLNAEGNGLSSSAWIQLSEEGSFYDKVKGDANKLQPLSTNYAQLAIQKGDELMDIAHVDAKEAYSLPIAFTSTIGGEFTLRATDFTISSDVEITFHDYQEGVSLKLDESFSYTFDTPRLKAQNIEPLSIIKSGVFRAKATDGTRFAITITPNTNSVSNETDSKVTEFALDQNYPNPFNPSTTINYSVKNSGAVNISVYNLMGQKVAELVNETKSAGSYNVTWNASEVSSGMYYYRLEAGGQSLTRKMTLIK
tara:strand:- start:12977 stop:15076 length:2100 start_codon:yes stop_codon:yes gene_type:complete